MVHTVHPTWGNRSCLRFGIYSEALDEERIDSTHAKNKRLRYCVVAGMIIVATLLVSKSNPFIEPQNVLFNKHLCSQIMVDEMGGTCSTHGGDKEMHKKF
jgi:hypothetical protein